MSQLKGGGVLDAPEETPEDVELVVRSARPVVAKSGLMGKAMKELPRILKHLGYDRLRQGQDRAIYSLFVERDTICVLPTAMGKTAVYVVPTLCHNWKCLIFSPLVSLMQDQVEGLWQKGLAAAQVSSGQTPTENQAALASWGNGDLQFLLVAPERMESEMFMDAMKRCPPDIITIDEAHCFQGFTKVATEIGPVAIRELHEQFVAGKVVPKVLSMDEQGRRSFKTITNSWRQPWRALYNIYTEHGSLRSTGNHQWWTKRGWVQADQLVPGSDQLYCVTNGQRKIRSPSPDQLQLLLGSFFGDGGLQKTAKTKLRYRCNLTHGLAQQGYAEWKMSVLGGYTYGIENNGFSHGPAVCGRGQVFELPWLLDKSNISSEMLDAMDGRALAVWIADDGSIPRTKAGEVAAMSLHTEDFPKASVQQIADWLERKFGVIASLRESKGKYWTLYLQREDAVRLLAVAQPFVHPSMSFKLEAPSTQTCYAWNAQPDGVWHELKRVEMANKVEHHKWPYLYDIEVEENHNLFVHAHFDNNISMTSGNSYLAHNCLSRWGTSFRPSYVRIGDFVEKLNPKVVLGLTATATPTVLKDIRNLLGLQQAAQVTYFPKRANLKLTSGQWQSDRDLLATIRSVDGPCIVYCLTRKRTEQLFYDLGPQIEGSAVIYHGEVEKDARTTNQTLFMRDEVRVVFATNAFGMGINKPNIRGIIHRDMPRSIEDFSQEVGRSGRDGLDSFCHLYVSDEAINTGRYFIDSEFPPRDLIESTYHFLKTHVDAKGILRMTLSDMATSMRQRNDRQVNSAVQILTRFKVVERTKDSESPAKITILKDHVDPKFQRYIDQVRMLGYNTGSNYELSLDSLMARIRVQRPTLLKALKDLQANHYLTYQLPYRGSTTKLIGGIDLVNFDDLTERRRDSLKKLDAMIEFADTPDEQKHDYLLRYFDVK